MRLVQKGQCAECRKCFSVCDEVHAGFTGTVTRTHGSPCERGITERVSVNSVGDPLPWCFPLDCLELLPPEETKREPKEGDVVDVSSARLLSSDGQRIINTVDTRRLLKLKVRDTRGGQHWLGIIGAEYLFREEDIIRYHN